MPRLRSIALLLAAAAGCEEEVHISAPGESPPATFWDLGTPPDRPPLPDAGHGPAGPCGLPRFPESTTLRRRPYLQSVTARSATIAWTTFDGAHTRLRLAEPQAPGAIEIESVRESFPATRTGDAVDYTAHVVDLNRLRPATEYCYEILDGDTVLATGLSFRTAPAPTGRPVRMLVFGDSGTGVPGQLQLRDRMLERRYDLFLHLGDIAYPTGTFDQYERFFFDVYWDLLHAVPVFPAVGNHDILTAGGRPYLDVYYLFEDTLRPADRERYYSFDWDDIHLVSLDSNPEMLATVSEEAQDDMLDWLRADLAASRATWKIAFFHHPAYSSGPHGSTWQVQSMILPILEENGVDLVLNGHDHDYERSVPIWQGAPALPGDRRAITYVVAGAGGGTLYGTVPGWFTATTDWMNFSFLDLEIAGCTATGRAITASGDEIDAFTLNGCD